MSQPLYFQYLPVVIIQRIIFYTDHVSLIDMVLLIDRDDVVKRIQKNSLALSQTCTQWRTVIFGLVYHKCELYADSEYYLISSDRKVTYSEFYNSVPCPEGIAHVRHLSIISNLANIALGNATAFLQSTELGELHFPSVTKLSVMLNTPDLDYLESKDIFEKLDAFAKYILRIAPNHVFIDIYNTTVSNPKREDVYFDYLNHLTNRLLTKAQRMSLTLAQEYFTPRNTVYKVPSNLTNLKCHIRADSEFVFRLIRKSSQTLETLLLEVLDGSTMAQLIVDEEGIPTRYLYLHSLSFTGKGLKTIETRAVFPDIAPFPRLHRLEIYGPYPFGDEVLFRDNANTLKVLRCRHDTEFVEMINSLLFKKEFKFPDLDSLETYTLIEDMDHSEQSAQECFAFIREMGASAKKLDIRHLDVASVAMKKLRTQDDKWGENIRNLLLGGLDLKFTQVLDLLKALPNLERLTSGLAEYEPLSESLEDTSFLDQIHKRYYLAFPKFRIWAISLHEVNNVEFTAICSMLLALACSGFHGILLPNAYMAEFRETLKILTSLYPYKTYPWLSKRLLPGLSWRRGTAKLTTK